MRVQNASFEGARAFPGRESERARDDDDDDDDDDDRRRRTDGGLNPETKRKIDRPIDRSRARRRPTAFPLVRSEPFALPRRTPRAEHRHHDDDVGRR